MREGKKALQDGEDEMSEVGVEFDEFEGYDDDN